MYTGQYSSIRMGNKLTSLNDVEKFKSVHFHMPEASVLLLSHLRTSIQMQQELIYATRLTKDSDS